MDKQITFKKALSLRNPLFIDLRSSSEYVDAHIPGAVNQPILDNEERALVGALYKKESPDLAIDKGLELAAPKLPELCRKIRELSRTKEIILYCWRGGMRSNAISQVLSLLGTDHYRLQGGYKAFREYINEFFAQPLRHKIILLNGLTGVGKTEILRKLAGEGYPVLDLEGLANNRGSVFGHIGEKKQPTQKQFEGLLFGECHRFREYRALAVECESKRIGSLVIPAAFYQAMQNGLKILIYDTLENRIRRLTETYAVSFTSADKERLCAALERLVKSLGREKVRLLQQLVRENSFAEVARRLLADYYDPMYHYPSGPSRGYEFSFNAGEPVFTLRSLQEILRKAGEPDFRKNYR